MKLSKNKNMIILAGILAVIAVMAFSIAVGFGPTKTGNMKNIRLGLDLAGGVSITYQTVQENPSAEDMTDTIYKLQKRVEGYSSESEVYQEGTNRINVEIPGVTDANQILKDLGKPGSIQFADPEGNQILDGTKIESAEAKTYQNDMGNNEYGVELILNEEGSKIFAETTANNIGKQIPIIFDGEVISAPTVEGAIDGGTAMISKMGSIEAAEELASTIRIGSLSLELEELRSNVVGAKLGEEAIKTSLMAGAIGFAIVILFMIFVYYIPGVASSIALCFYLGTVMLMLNAFDITLTLPGIAGIILSIGMAVDANVIIYARIKEEITAGSTVQIAIKTGFSKALSAIVDGNVTTLIAAVILGIKGSGGVKGFAQTLAIGVVVSMFTALIISRLVIYAFYVLGIRDKKFYGVQKTRKVINFLAKKKLFFGISIVAICVGVVFLGVNKSQAGQALNYSLEFKGGTSTNVAFNEDMDISDLDSKVKPVVEKITNDGAIQMQKVSGSNEVIIKTRELNVDEREALNKAIEDEFGVDETAITAESISSTISNEMQNDAIIAVVLATICMLIYIWFRFKDVRFASSAVLALLHDVMIVLAFYAISKTSVGSTFIACMLTIVGYSINATIVIFDRIRENRKLAGRGEALDELVNRSITQTLTRSIYTSFTTFVMVAILYVLGVTAIREFAMPLMVGIVCGAYSSVCVTGALWYIMKPKAKQANKIEAK